VQFKWENIGIKTRVEKNRVYYLDPVRRDYFVATPEEEVRQWLIHYMRTHLGYPLACFAVEKQITYNQKRKRFDILIYKDGTPAFLVECKAPHIEISQATLNQIGVYNLNLKVPYLLVSNGQKHICCKLRRSDNSFEFLNTIPSYDSLTI